MVLASTRHEINEWRPGFSELLNGKPFIMLRDSGYEPGHALVVNEYDSYTRRRTGAMAIFHITWVSRPTDFQGAFASLLSPDAIVLGLEPAHVLVKGDEVSIVVDGRRAKEPPVACTHPAEARQSVATSTGTIETCSYCVPLLPAAPLRRTLPNAASGSPALHRRLGQ